MKTSLRRISLLMIAISIIGSFCLTLPHIDPPFTDKAVIYFFQARGYLPAKNELSREEIAPALIRLLSEERDSYRVIFWLSTVGLIGFVGFSASTRIP